MDEIQKLIVDAKAQWRNLWRSLFLLYLPILLLFIGVGILSRVVEGASLQFFLRDVTATGGLPFFAGFVSQLGMILWSASLTICLFGWLVLSRRTGDPVPSRSFLLHAGILTGMLLVDDIFLFHEEIAPNYLHINEKFVVAAYVAMGIYFVASNWREILSSEYLILFLALALFGLSIFVDALPIRDFNIRYFWELLGVFLEDGFKFMGIATWLVYFARYAYHKLVSVAR